MEKNVVAFSEMSPKDFHDKILVPEARAQINYLITGLDVIYNSGDPNVNLNFNKRVDEAIQAGEYFDSEGKKHKTPNLDNDQSVLSLANKRIGRLMELVQYSSRGMVLKQEGK